MEKKAILQKTAAWVKSAMKENDPAHDPGHVRRVVQLTRTLCCSEPEADAFRAELLAWLHDMNDDKLSSNRGLAVVKSFLLDLGVTPEDVSFVCGGIPYISYRKHPKLDDSVPLEIRVVQDADRIDAMGAMGIARTFAYGGAHNRSLEESLQHFEEKLLHLYDLLSTDSAKAIAQSRHNFLLQFYHRFLEEEQLC